MSDIAVWLKKLDLGKYQELFAENEIDVELLPKLTEQHLKELGLPMGPRLKLLEAIAALAPEKNEEKSPTGTAAGAGRARQCGDRREHKAAGERCI